MCRVECQSEQEEHYRSQKPQIELEGSKASRLKFQGRLYIYFAPTLGRLFRLIQKLKQLVYRQQIALCEMNQEDARRQPIALRYSRLGWTFLNY